MLQGRTIVITTVGEYATEWEDTTEEEVQQTTALVKEHGVKALIALDLPSLTGHHFFNTDYVVVYTVETREV